MITQETADKIRAMHEPAPIALQSGLLLCYECGHAWPCPTLVALDEACS